MASRYKPDLKMLCKIEGLPEPFAEYRFDAERKWRLDWAWPSRRLAAEVDGATWTQGRHTRGQGYENDCEKLNAAALEDWRVLRFTTQMVNDGRAIATLKKALGR